MIVFHLGYNPLQPFKYLHSYSKFTINYFLVHNIYIYIYIYIYIKILLIFYNKNIIDNFLYYFFLHDPQGNINRPRYTVIPRTQTNLND